MFYTLCTNTPLLHRISKLHSKNIDSFHCLHTFVLQSLASELARTPAKSVTFSTDTEPSTPTRTGRSKLSRRSSFFVVVVNRPITSPFTVNFPSLPEQRGVSRTPQKVGCHRLSYLHTVFSFILFFLNVTLVYYCCGKLTKAFLCVFWTRIRRFSLCPQRRIDSERGWQVSWVWCRNGISGSQCQT